MQTLKTLVVSIALTAILPGCATYDSISSYRPGSGDPLVFGGTRNWIAFFNGTTPGEGANKAKLAMLVFPPLMLIPVLDGILSMAADIVLLPITVPWAIMDAQSSASVADRFDATIRKIKKRCAESTLSRGEVCSGNFHILSAADPLSTEEGRFAHSIVIPKENRVESEMNSSKNSQEHFDFLRKTYACEFIYRTVDRIEGVLQLRPHLDNPYASGHLYAAEDPYGVTSSFSPGGAFSRPSGYQFS